MGLPLSIDGTLFVGIRFPREPGLPAPSLPRDRDCPKLVLAIPIPFRLGKADVLAEYLGLGLVKRKMKHTSTSRG
jgi:hypothetical protein